MVTVAPVVLRTVAERILLAVGTPPETAACVADSLLSANLAGHDSHGVMKLPSYVRDIRGGKLHPAAVPSVEHETATTAVIDGAGAFGHLGARFAADTASAKAQQCGIAYVAVRRCHHTGRLGNWSERIAASGMVAMLVGGEAQPPHMVVPHGGRHGALATNPITWAFPRSDGRPPVVLDYATSVVSIGKLQAAQQRGEGVPPGWVVDAAGRPSEDLAAFFGGGFLLPFGGYKGYALGVLAELCSVGLSSGDRVERGQRSSCLSVMALDPEAFRPRNELDEFVGQTLARLKAIEPTRTGSPVLVPGEPEDHARHERSAGIPVPDSVWTALDGLASEVGAQLDELSAP